MNIIAIDIGNTNIAIALFLDDELNSLQTVAGSSEDAPERISDILSEAWHNVPIIKGSKEAKRDGHIILCSVKDEWTRMVTDICLGTLAVKTKLIGTDIPLPIEMGVDKPF